MQRVGANEGRCRYSQFAKRVRGVVARKKVPREVLMKVRFRGTVGA